MLYRLLEYGELALTSPHQKPLLTTGLHYVVSNAKKFNSLDTVRAMADVRFCVAVGRCPGAGCRVLLLPLCLITTF